MKIKFLLLFSSLLFLFKPNVCFTQVVDLGSATSFSLFTSAGLFSNDSTTHIVGDIGTNTGPFSGFPPGIVTGSIQVANSVSASVAADVNTAFNTLNAMPCGMVIGNTLGNGQVFTPNTYCIHAVTTLNGNLTLDGQGNPNAVFIFKIDSAFTAGMAANIILINSASLCNVYWQVHGSFSLGASAGFQGTVLAGGAITLNLNSSLNGRVLSIAGAINLHKTTVTINPSPLASISASGSTFFCQGDSITLTASTANSFLWSTGATTKSIIVRSAGSYSVTVTNACGKATSAATIINVNPLPITTISANGPLMFCQGDSVKLTASGGTKFLWSTGDTTSVITVKASGSYTVIGTNANGCKGTSAASVVTVNPNPSAIITANGPLTFCQGDSVRLTASGGTKYIWSKGDTTSVITVKASGSYTVIGTNANGCKGTSVASVVTVNPNPTAIITANGPLTFCQGDSVKLTASGGSKFLWSNGDTLATITVKTSGSYSVLSTNANGCKGTSVTTIITTNPSISASGPLTFCQGDSVKLTASGGSKFLWSNGDTLATITVKTSGSYTVVTTNAGGCKGTSVGSVVTVNPKPIAIITANGPLTFCPGDSVKLTASGGSKYLWSTGDTLANITVKQSGSYTVVTTNANGCKGTSAATIITTYPSISAIGPLNFCQGDSVKLTASGTKFLWSNGDTLATITVKTSGSYTVIGGCKDTSKAIIINVNPNPTAIITASSPLTFCQGDSVKLTASGGSKYLWSTGDSISVITVKASGSYTVVSTNINGCKGTSVASLITVNPNPTAVITASGPLTFCQSDSVNLTTSGGSKYLWSSGDTSSTITVKASGSYTVVSTKANGCTSTSIASVVTVNPGPIAIITANGPLNFCPGDSVKLTASGGSKYLWSSGDTSSTITVKASGSYTVVATNATGCRAISGASIITTSPTISASGPLTFCQGDSVKLTANGSKFLWSTGDTVSSITVKTSGSYTVIGRCNDTSKATVITVNPNPTAIITANGPITFCQGDSVKLTASGGSKFLWSTGDSISVITVKATGSYTVVSTNINGCKGTSFASLITVNPNPTAVITASGLLTFCQGDSVNLTTSGGSKYLWSRGDTTSTITVKASGSYTVVSTKANGCISTSIASVVTVNPSFVPTISASGPLTFCPGDSVILTSSVSGKYTWSTGDTTQQITVKTTGSYTVTTPGLCAGVSAQTIVLLNPVVTPTITVSGRLNLCPGDSVKLTSSLGTGNFWNTGDTTQSIIVRNSGFYTVIGSGACSDTAQPVFVKVIVDTFPVITSSGPTTFCQGGQVILTASKGDRYFWSFGGKSQSVAVSTSGTYWVSVTKVCGSKTTTRLKVVVNPIPDCTIIATSPQCALSSTMLCVTATNAKYLWNTGDTTQCISPGKAGTYSVKVINASGCSSTCSKTLTGGTLPDCTISGVSILCPMQTSILSAPAGATTQSIAMWDADTYTVTVTNSNGCSSSCSKVVSASTSGCLISGNLNICAGETTELKGPMDATSYLWSTGSTAGWITVYEPGTYSLTITSAQGCVIHCSQEVLSDGCITNLQGYRSYVPDYSSIYQQKSERIVTTGKAGKELTLPSGTMNAQAYPNPFVQSTMIEFSSSVSQPVSVDIYNVQGQKIASLFKGMLSRNERRQVRFDATDLKEDVYFYRITEGKTSISRKLVLMKN